MDLPEYLIKMIFEFSDRDYVNNQIIPTYPYLDELKQRRVYRIGCNCEGCCIKNYFGCYELEFNNPDILTKFDGRLLEKRYTNCNHSLPIRKYSPYILKYEMILKEFANVLKKSRKEITQYKKDNDWVYDDDDKVCSDSDTAYNILINTHYRNMDKYFNCRNSLRNKKKFIEDFS